MKITQKNNEKNGAFFAMDNETVAGEMTYVWGGDKQIIIDHTEVLPQYEGQGIGNEMVKKSVDFAREKHIKILPLCSFAQSVFEKTPAYKDVLA